VETAQLPLLLVTSRDDPHGAGRALRAGANDYIDKPFSAAELIARVDLHLSLRRATEHSLQTERLATLGLLSSGFAHDVRNPLNGVINALPPLAERIRAQDMESALALVDIMQSSVERLGALSQMFLSLGRTGSAPERILLAEALEKTLHLLGPRVPREVVIERRYLYNGSICGSAGPLTQVWINLLDNALRAVGSHGSVLVSVERAGKDAVVTVVDSGRGIRPEHLESVFQPFFTTRPDGTGLGLALCRRIVLEHGGRIQAKSQAGKGAQFIVALPIDPVPAAGPGRGASA
jgi:signal transduction histidine kinase